MAVAAAGVAVAEGVMVGGSGGMVAVAVGVKVSVTGVGGVGVVGCPPTENDRQNLPGSPHSTHSGVTLTPACTASASGAVACDGELGSRMSRAKVSSPSPMMYFFILTSKVEVG